MSVDEGVADLHLHTTASDGTATVAERIERAADLGLSAIAVTDHDGIDPGLEGRRRLVGDLEVITGVEVRAGCRETKVELLGYYVDPDDDALQDLLAEVRGYRERRNRELVDRVAAATEVETSYDALAAGVDGGLGRPHVAELLVEEGVVDSIGAAFEEHLGPAGDCYVPMGRADHEAVLDALHAAGGVASLAHPGRISGDAALVRAMLEDLVSAGLDAIEVWYPYERTAGDDRYADVGVDEAAALATEYDLLPTGGSDCHGPGSGKERFGQVRVRRDVLDRLRRAAGV